MRGRTAPLLGVHLVMHMLLLATCWVSEKTCVVALGLLVPERGEQCVFISHVYLYL